MERSIVESTNIIWFACILALIVGSVIGIIASTIFSKSRQTIVRQLEKSLKEIEQEFADYRKKVSHHFNTTAQLTHNLTQNYRDIYQHLADGADKLCDDNAVHSQLTDDLIGTALLSSDLTNKNADITQPSDETACPATKTLSLTKKNDNPLCEESNTRNESEKLDHITPPRDYAPKQHPDEKGMLSEDFSIEHGPDNSKTIEDKVESIIISEPIITESPDSIKLNATLTKDDVSPINADITSIKTN